MAQISSRYSEQRTIWNWWIVYSWNFPLNIFRPLNQCNCNSRKQNHGEGGTTAPGARSYVVHGNKRMEIGQIWEIAPRWPQAEQERLRGTWREGRIPGFQTQLGHSVTRGSLSRPLWAIVSSAIKLGGGTKWLLHLQHTCESKTVSIRSKMIRGSNKWGGNTIIFILMLGHGCIHQALPLRREGAFREGLHGTDRRTGKPLWGEWRAGIV